MIQGYTFKEIDTRHGKPKGTAFRAFKRLGQELREGEHFLYLAGRREPEGVERLRRAGRIYASTVNVVVLTDAGYGRVRSVLDE